MYTLQEFINFAKGWEYIIAIAAIFIFMAFWRLLSGTSSPEKGRQRKTTGHNKTANLPGSAE